MLQEKSWKILANAIHKAFARITFDEYKNKLLHFEPEPSPTGGDAESIYFPQALGTDHNEENEFSKVEMPDISPYKTEHNSQYASKPPINNTSLNYSTMQNRVLQNTFNQDPNFANDVPGTTGGRQSDVRQFVKSNPISTNLDKSKTSFDRDHDATIIGDTIQKKQTSSTHQQSKHPSDVSPTLQKSKVMQSTVAQMPQQVMPQYFQPIMTQPVIEEIKQTEYIKIGDIVCIEFTEQIFDGLKEYAKIDEGKDNLRLAKILEKPDFEYKGVIYSDGIVDKEFKVIPKEIKSSSNRNFTNQNKSIFRIEVPQDYRYTKQYNELKIELSSVEFSEMENPNEEIEKRIIFNDIETKYKKEIKANKNEQLFNTGRNVLFGQDIQLRHISSGLFVTLNTKQLSNEYGWFELKLSYCNEFCRFKFMPPQKKIRELNEPISYEDTFIVQNSKEKTGYFLHCNASDLYTTEGEERRKLELSVNASHGDVNATRWMLNKYFSKSLEDIENDKVKVTTMDTIRFFHREVGGYLTVTRRDVESNLPEYPDFLKKEIAILAEEKDDLNEDEEDEIIIEEGKVEQEILIYIEKDINKLDRTNTLWEVQRTEWLTGGDITIKDKYLIRHVGTGMYLSTADHIELNLTVTGNSFEWEFSFENEGNEIDIFWEKVCKIK